MSSTKKIFLGSGIIIFVVLILSNGSFAKRLGLPEGLFEAMQNWFSLGNVELHACDYKDGEILLIKPVATGVGEGRYEAGDIVEIRDGETLCQKFGNGNFLGSDERTKLLPVYYPKKLSEEEKEELLAPEYEINETVIPASSSVIPAKAGIQNSWISDQVGDNKSGSPIESGMTDSLSAEKILQRRRVGVDYTKFLSDSEILKIRQFEKLNKLPEIDLTSVTDKKSGVSFDKSLGKSFVLKQNKKSAQGADSFASTNLVQNSGLSTYLNYNPFKTIVKGSHLLTENSIKNTLEVGGIEPPDFWLTIQRPHQVTPRALSLFQGKNVFGNLLKIKNSELASVVKLPLRIAVIENSLNFVKYLASSISKPVIAAGESIKTVDTGGTGNYLSLNAWEAGEQANLVANNTIAVAKCQSTQGSADAVAVSINGWTTDSNHYVKIMTDPSESFRHNGKWDNKKYRLVAMGSTGVGAMGVYEDYTWIDGLQINETSSGNYAAILNNASYTKFSNNLLTGVLGTNFGIRNGTTGSLVWNNILYDFVGGSGIYNLNSSYIYNNTFYNITYAIQYAASITIKNNIFASSTYVAYNVSCTAVSNNNATDLANFTNCTTRSNDQVSQTFIFTLNTETVKDYHLYATGTAVIGLGMNLTTDLNLPISTDIDGQPRPLNGAWDIGADQLVATQIYRSVGPSNTTAISSSTGATLTIAGSNATFSSAMPANMGVGDVIVYQAAYGSSTKNSLAFISGRTDATHYSVQDVDGKIASSTSATANWQVFRAYASLAKAEGGDENDGLPDSLEPFESWSGGKNLASSSEVWNIACYADAADTGVGTMTGWLVSVNNYINIFVPNLPTQVGVSQRHNGKWDNTKYRIENTLLYGFDIYNPYTRVDGVQIKHTYSAALNSRAFMLRSGNYSSISNSILWGVISGSAIGTGIDFGSARGYAFNNIVYGFINGSSGTGITDATGSAIYNNTVYGCAGGFYSNFKTAVLKNNIAYNNITDYNVNTTWNSSCTHNISKDNSAPPIGVYYRNQTVQFVDISSTTAPDLHLRAGDFAARKRGINLSTDAALGLAGFNINVDIDNEFRPETGSSTGAWDIGADQVAHTTQINSPLSGRFKDPSLVGYWSFDGKDTGTTSAADLSGNNNTGWFYNGVKKVSGINGQALQFDGIDDYVNVGTDLNRGTAGTVSAWVYITDINKTSPDILCIKEGTDTNSAITYRVYDGNGGQAYDGRFNIAVRPEGTNTLIAYGDTVAVNNHWYHVVYTMDSSDGFKMYVDGEQETLTYFAGDASVKDWWDDLPVGALWDIGRQYWSGASAALWTGTIDDVRVYSRALTAAEIKEQYDAGAARMKVNTPAGNSLANSLVGYWSFDGKDMGTTSATDLSGNSNTGWLYNGAKKVPGKIGQGLSFDAIDDYVDAGKNSTLNNLSTLTYSAWIYPRSFSINFNILSKRYRSLFVQASTGYLFFFASTNDTNMTHYCSSPVISSNAWTHVVYSWDGVVGSGTAGILYVNGQPCADDTITGSGSVSADTSFGQLIGADYNGGTNAVEEFLNGMLDDVRIYNRQLSASEIQQLYSTGVKTMKVGQ